MMGFWHPVTNLRDYVSQNPPGVTFFLCLLTLAISFICLSSYSYRHTQPNPDAAEDWNHLLSSLSQFQLCVKDNTSSSELPVASALMDRDASVNSTKSPSLTTLRLMVPLAVTSNETVNMTLEFLSGNDTYTCLTISAPVHLLPMRLLPPECPVFENDISPIYVEAVNQLPPASHTCYSLHSTKDRTLTVMLTQEEQSVAVRHLLEEPLLDT
ncbi:Transmembrane protein 248 [Liparis tanakae]|uniref:Transmembrane protein 248 n=1 Tax=Liparis tanakae TaxID=230148 RepID=A0A4Z2FQK2_9TELE|nr:Transmembrane protein 248 [Liparis tanakae]